MTKVSTLFIYDSICASMPVPYFREPVIIFHEGVTVKIGFCGASIRVERARVLVVEANRVAPAK